MIEISNIDWYAAGLGVIATASLLSFIFLPAKPRKISEFPRCNCSDVNQCEVWCVGKENFTKATNYSITEVCEHPNIIIQVTQTTATCETAVEVCADCFKELSEPKTDCR